MVSTNDLKNGMVLNLDGQLWSVIWFQHHKPGKGGAVAVELPASVELKIEHTDPGVKGDRVSGAMKPATLSTGVTVQVPLFIESGETVRVDTRTGEYLTRVS